MIVFPWYFRVNVDKFCEEGNICVRHSQQKEILRSTSKSWATVSRDRLDGGRSASRRDGKFVQVHIIFLRKLSQTLSRYCFQCSRAHPHLDHLISLLPPQLLRLQVDVLHTMRMHVRLGHRHGLTILPCSCNITLTLTHYQVGPARLKGKHVEGEEAEKA